ncbi:MAG: carbon starvation protein A [Prolixibacteraceae bacterium]|nr:carbon starvation protein A [Prolixibacteraceae bacterium]
MKPLILMLLTLAGYLLMYRLYGRFISRKIFQLKDNRDVPSETLNDGIDYTPTKKGILFGHHFASIAGTGPIVGPAIAVIWGWLPAVLWVFFGSILIGGLHDLGALVISLRNQGKSIADFSGKYINKQTRYAVFFIGFLLLWIFISILGMIIAIIFDMFPGAVIPIWLEIPIAIWVGYKVNTQKKNMLKWSIIGVALMYIAVVIGTYIPIEMPVLFGIEPTGSWTFILLFYAFVASVLPVKTLLQPRDFINSHQLLIAMALLFSGVIFTTIRIPEFDIVAPAIVNHPEGAPLMFPFLFIIVACGAVSGFHSLVSSGTSSKQISNEKHALPIGYGGMLTESALSLFVIIASIAGIGLAYTTNNNELLTGYSAWHHHYESWQAAQGLASKVQAFVIGSSNMIASTGIPRNIALVIMGVFVASFAGTSLDTSVRLQRFFVSEIIPKNTSSKINNRYVLSAFVVIFAGLLAYSTGANGKGALTLWPLFGVVNQILAALALSIITTYLIERKNKYWLLAGLPALFMNIITIWGSIENHLNFWAQQNYLLIITNLVILILSIYVLFAVIMKIIKK